MQKNDKIFASFFSFEVYDMPESQFKLNEVVEFIGIYTFDPDIIASNNNDDVDDDMMIFNFMDDVATHLPPSKVCNCRYVPFAPFYW
jgi:Mini-chromosome maintenance replisome factor